MKTKSDCKMSGLKLIKAAKKGQYKRTLSLLNKKRDIDQNDMNQALYEAAENGHESIVRILLGPQEYKLECPAANIHAGNFFGPDAAFRIAAKNGHESIVRLLLDPKQYGLSCEQANIHATEMGEPDSGLTWAAYYGHESIVRLLLDPQNHDLNCEPAVNRASLSAAISEGRMELFQLLLNPRNHGLNNDGADIHAQNDMALRTAASQGHLEMVKILLMLGADVHASDNNGPDAALHWAARCGYLEVTQLLLEHGADVNAHLQHNGSILESTVSSFKRPNQKNIICLLLKYGADFRRHNDRAFNSAANLGHYEIANIFLNPQTYGLDPEIEGYDHEIFKEKSPLTWAKIQKINKREEKKLSK